ncbi:HAD family hydrolase [Streptomyces marincola]|uniref:Hydrolase n=1 Tax=Streptomyces marincola TaxID=2878388 RepID=A0A1W7CUL2_9ACTN|nr:HAD-IA family hydrolase [Streptomyces marincola]ARQ68491.1 hydrolase [Streptomyces marincola]
MTVQEFDALLCDLDGVLRLWDAEEMRAIDRATGLPDGSLAAAAFHPPLLDAAVTGRITDEQWRERVAAGLAGAHGSRDAARDAVRQWSVLTGRVDAEVVALLRWVRRTVPVVLVSNATTRLEADLAALGLDRAFDAVVNTSRIGFAKPDPRVLHAAAGRVGADPARCLFVDDTAGHVEAARAAGLRAHHYRTADGLRAALGHPPG